MSALAVALLVVAAFDPAVVGVRTARARTTERAAGAALAAGAAALLAWTATGLLDRLRIEPESMWVAAGLVLAATGAVRVVVPLGVRPVPGDTGGNRVVSIAYPGVFGPELVLAALAAGAHDDALAATIALAVAVAAVVVWPGERSRLRLAAARLVAAGQVVLAVALVLDGIRSV